MNQQAQRKPKHPRAIVSATYATLWQGRRLVRFYHSGEKLVGIIP